MGARMAEMSEEVLVKFEEGMTAREFHFAKEVTEADAIINLCKMKTHMLERVTGAVKNSLWADLRDTVKRRGMSNTQMPRCLPGRLPIFIGV